ncbi:MAG: carbohydrate kinase family protein [Parcubacteria group bacterium]|nr:carbohydrate kinase family protein [Parcubacteria group bacterium]
MKRFDVISIGDTQHDVFLELEEETKVLEDRKTKTKYLGVVYAEKISVKKFTSIVAVGNSANVAIGCSRLGLKTAFYTVLGFDTVGREELAVFKKEKVALDYIVWDRKHGSNFSAVLNYQAERTILVHHEHRNYVLPRLAPSKWVYLSSMGPGFEKIHGALLRYVKKHKVKMGFNPGSFQMRAGLKKLAPVIRRSAVFFVNREEAETLLKKRADIKTLLRLLYQLGPKIVVITDGPKGSYSFDGKHALFLPIFPAKIVERTGTGDAYSTGFISALAYDYGVVEAMRWGTFNAASKIQSIGARQGLLSKSAMTNLVKKNKKFQPKNIV